MYSTKIELTAGSSRLCLRFQLVSTWLWRATNTCYLLIKLSDQ